MQKDQFITLLFKENEVSDVRNLRQILPKVQANKLHNNNIAVSISTAEITILMKYIRDNNHSYEVRLQMFDIMVKIIINLLKGE